LEVYLTIFGLAALSLFMFWVAKDFRKYSYSHTSRVNALMWAGFFKGAIFAFGLSALVVWMFHSFG